MTNRDRSRLAAFNASLTVLNAPEHKPLWFDKNPKVFTRLVAEATAAVENLEAICQAQSTKITGTVADKAREERELEDVCILYGTTVGLYFQAAGNEADAAKVDFAESVWRRMPEQELIATSRVLIDLMNSILAEVSPESAAEWGITPETVSSVQKESDDFAAIAADPQSLIAKRKALTSSLRAEFRAVTDKFDVLDRLINHFTTTPAGAAMATAYRNARNIIERGHRRKPTDPDPTMPPDKPVLS
ncbi:MAG: hypothetical protein KDA62_21930 [Planctomycetales bacterium]|nr:hypothetical protein [Planctomycetales bacterium]